MHPAFRILIRWLVFPLVCLVTLAALFVAEENLRGKLAWDGYKRELEARGEHLDFNWYIPPPVPDDENFAIAPPFNLINMDPGPGYPGPTDKEEVQWRDKLILYGGRGSDKHPQLKPGLNWQEGNPADLDGWQQYYEGALPDFTPTQSAAADVVAATNRLDDMFAELREAAKTRPQSRFDVQYQKGVATPLPHYVFLMGLVSILRIRATAELRLNRTADAFDDLELAFRLMDSVRDEPLLISGLVRIGGFATLMQPVWEGITAHRWSDSQLAALEAEMQGMDWLSEYLRALRSERANFFQVIQWAIDKPGMLQGMSDQQVDWRMGALLGSMRIFRGWAYQNMVAESRWVEENRDCIDPARQTVDLPRLTREEEALNGGFAPYHFVARMMTDAIGGALQRFAIAQTWANEGVIACEIERYRLAHGKLPASLEDLHMANLPHDVMNGQPLHYAPKGGGDYVLYSTGWNGIDNGGKVVFKPNSSALDFSKGDWVWSTVPVEVEKSLENPSDRTGILCFCDPSGVGRVFDGTGGIVLRQAQDSTPRLPLFEPCGFMATAL